MTRSATVEVNKFGVVVTFPSSPNTAIYKMLIKSGFTKTGALGWHHWIHQDQSAESKAEEIVREFNAGKPNKKYRLYPKKSIT